MLIQHQMAQKGATNYYNVINLLSYFNKGKQSVEADGGVEHEYETDARDGANGVAHLNNECATEFYCARAQMKIQLCTSEWKNAKIQFEMPAATRRTKIQP